MVTNFGASAPGINTPPTKRSASEINFFKSILSLCWGIILSPNISVNCFNLASDLSTTWTFALRPVAIKVIRSGKVRRAKLYYLRDRTGKSARITEKIKKKIGIDVESKPEEVNEENLAPVVEEKTIDKPKTSEETPEAPKAEIKKEEIKKDTPEEKK